MAAPTEASAAPGTVPRPARSLDEFAVMARRCEPAVRAAIHGDAVRAGVDVEDVVQEAVCRGLAHAEELTTEASVRAWLIVVARRILIDRVRSAYHRRVRLHGDRSARVWGVTADAMATGVERELGSRMRQALAALPSSQRRALLAHAIGERSRQEIADELGLSYTAVGPLLYRATRAMRKHYDRLAAVVLVPLGQLRRLVSHLRRSVEPVSTGALVAGVALAVAGLVVGGASRGPVRADEDRAAVTPLWNVSGTIAARHALPDTGAAPRRGAGHVPSAAPMEAPRDLTAAAAAPVSTPVGGGVTGGSSSEGGGVDHSDPAPPGGQTSSFLGLPGPVPNPCSGPLGCAVRGDTGRVLPEDGDHVYVEPLGETSPEVGERVVPLCDEVPDDNTLVECERRGSPRWIVPESDPPVDDVDGESGADEGAAVPEVLPA